MQLERLTPQHQPRFEHAPSFAVVRSYVDQLVRAGAIDDETLGQVTKFVDRAERFATGPQARAAQANLHALANQLDGGAYDDLRAALRGLAGT